MRIPALLDETTNEKRPASMSMDEYIDGKRVRQTRISDHMAAVKGSSHSLASSAWPKPPSMNRSLSAISTNR